MEKRKNSLSALKMCRFCLAHDGTLLTSLYDRHNKPKKGITLPLKILSCLSVEIFPSDSMPTFICQGCKFFIGLFHDYKEMCRRADEKILQFVQLGIVLEPTKWPTLLTKIHRSGIKSKPNVMKTVTEDGATVQVTSQDGSDSEEEDEEDVYNIKIGDGSQESSKCIKVVTSKGEDKDKIKSPKEMMSSEADSDEDDAPRAPVRMRSTRGSKEKVYPCDQCDCTYPLHQLLILHKRQKHRARNVTCDQCNAKFFTKFDLMVHQVRHSDDMPFQCVACDRKFKRLVLLKRHEKMMHPDIPQLKCGNCSATFLSLEELQVHQRRHSRHFERNHLCMVCDKRFLNKATLRKHMDVVHPKKPAFFCEYCPAQLPSVTRLTRHIRTHVRSDRLFPCKYCDKSFTRSHHYTRHVRLSHRGEARNSSRATGPSDQFRCDQCDECFESQDELIYHSAIHATQNLTCPLCQEKFEDVDAVTAHIKSHVNGTEFMCDLCELVFTSKDKLDNHLTSAHAEELDHEESMEEMDAEEAEEDEDDNGINVKEEDGHMVVEIKKTDGFMLPEAQNNVEEKQDGITNSEESEAEATYTELATVDTLAMPSKEPAVKEEIANASPSTVTKEVPKPTLDTGRDQTASILRKAEEVKRKAQQIISEPAEKKEKIARVETSNLGASDKSLRLLEKELQELKRTNTRNEVPKTPVRTMETLRNRRPQLHTSTPKTRAESEKKLLASIKSQAEKKIPERKALVQIKENKEPKEVKDIKSNSTHVKEEKEKATKEEVKEREKETPKSVVKSNGTNEKAAPEETVRRSTRPSKIKDYARMIKDKSQESNDESDDGGDDEYKESDKIEVKTKTRRGSTKTPVKASPTAPGPAPGTARKRGRPRKDAGIQKEIPCKIKKADSEEPEDEKETEGETRDLEKSEPEPSTSAESAPVKQKQADTSESGPSTSNDGNEIASTSGQKTPPGGNVLMSPTGQTLKKVPIRALPPGIKPLPLPSISRPMGSGELCEMQIGKKVVKVQKIVMTKAEVEAMAKKGLVEMKDGTMVLKQGIKLPTSDALSLKSTLVGDKETTKESPSKMDKLVAPSTSQE